MPIIRYAGQSLSVKEGESVLETLLSAGCEVPNSCHAGVCQSCLMQLESGEVQPDAQKGLKDSWQLQRLFLACQCRPDRDLEIRLPAMDNLRVTCEVTGHTRLSSDVVAIRLKLNEEFEYRPGQHVTLWRDPVLGRSYSLASVPDLDGDELEFHVKHLPEGSFSPWLHDGLRIGDRLQIQGPAGDCFYTGGDLEQSLLLAGTGTGLAPLYGIARDALRQGHTGEIHLYHGALDADGLYLHETLKGLAEGYANLHYHPCTLSSTPGQDPMIQVGKLDELLGRERAGLRGWKVYLCGADEFVNKQRKLCFLSGARIQEIYADVFTPASVKVQ
jgi:NAD(P)H-flavin reductase